MAEEVKSAPTRFGREPSSGSVTWMVKKHTIKKTCETGARCWQSAHQPRWVRLLHSSWQSRKTWHSHSGILSTNFSKRLRNLSVLASVSSCRFCSFTDSSLRNSRTALCLFFALFRGDVAGDSSAAVEGAGGDAAVGVGVAGEDVVVADEGPGFTASSWDCSTMACS